MIVLTVLLMYLAPTADSSTRPLAVTIAEITKTETTEIILELPMMVGVAQIPRAGSPGSSSSGCKSVRGVTSRSNSLCGHCQLSAVIISICPRKPWSKDLLLFEALKSLLVTKAKREISRHRRPISLFSACVELIVYFLPGFPFHNKG